MNGFTGPKSAAVAVGMLLTLALGASADTPEVMMQAKQQYKDGKFAEVIELLTNVAMDTTLKASEQKDVYLLLAKATAAKSFPEQAAIYMRKVVEIDPSFRLDTKVEPPQVQRVWFKVDSARAVTERVSKGNAVAILYFENNSVADREKLDGLSKGLSAMLVTDLSTVGGITIVERERIQWIIEELKLEQSEYFNKDLAVKMGQQLGAHRLVMGSFSKLDKNKMRIDARLVKTETGEVLKADKVEGKPAQLAKLQNSLTRKIASWLEVKVSTKDGGEPIEAVLAYTRGLNLEDEMQLAAAYEAYKEALAVYPKLKAAQDRLSALEPFIAITGG